MKFLILIFFVIFSCATVYGQYTNRRFVLDAAAGWGRQDLSWSIAGNEGGGNPNIYSELKWKRLSGLWLDARAQWKVGKNWIITGSYNRQFIHSGTVSDHDYNGDNRTNEVYSSDFAADRGYSSGWRIGAGYQVVTRTRFLLSAFAGYTSVKQWLSISDREGNSGLNSNYRPFWKGAFLESSAQLNLGKYMQVMADLSYSQLSYRAAADWNLIQIFQHPVSYRHHAVGYELEGAMKLTGHINRSLDAYIGTTAFFRRTGKGTDDLYLADGSVDRTQLNGVRNSGGRFSLGLSVKY